MDEFSLIQQYFQRPSSDAVKANHQLVMGIGDDCAILDVPRGQQLVFSIDTMVEGVHFTQDTAPADIAWRLLGAAVSDLAAMGATPNNFTLALTIPELSEPWLQSFSDNLSAAAQAYQITLAGGDTSRGPLTLSVQVQGFVDSGQALLRSGANTGDVICVTGTLGDSRAGLSLLDHLTPDADQQYLLDRFYRPVPRVASGLLIKKYATACIDISDGLLADLGHVLSRSKKGAKIDSAAIPLSPQLKHIAGDKALHWALSGGEDFELCFTLSAENWRLLQRELQQAEPGIALCEIGVVTEESGLQIFQDNKWQAVTAQGFQHFSNE